MSKTNHQITKEEAKSVWSTLFEEYQELRDTYVKAFNSNDYAKVNSLKPQIKPLEQKIKQIEKVIFAF